MKTRSGIGSLLTTTLLLLIGVCLIYGNAINPEFGVKINDVLAIPLNGIILGGIMIASVVFGWIARFFKKKEKFIDFPTEDGSVSISARAIQDFIQRVGKEFTAIKSIDSQLVHVKDDLDIAISMKVVSGNKIPELTQVLKQRVRESVRESLGIEQIRNITVKVAEIVGDPAKHVEDVPTAE